MTYVWMLLFLIVYAAIILAQVKYQPGKESFFDLHDSTMFKGAFCIIVVLVHVPAAYQNRIQDMMGSFAYIGVTFFFMTSAYGLKYGVAHKENYLQGFWKKRLPAILVPAIFCNIAAIAINAADGKTLSIISFVNVNDWVKVLLLFYLVFWAVYYAADKRDIRRNEKNGGGGYYKDALICLAVILFSLIDRLTPLKLTFIWPTESVGFAYGIILADCAEWMKAWSGRRWLKKSFLFLLVGGITGSAYLKFKSAEFLGDYCLKIFLGFVLLVLMLQLIRRIKIGNKALAFLGSISYEVYLLHGAVFTFLAGVSGIENSGVFIWSAVIITVVIAAIVKMVSMPVIGVLKNIGRV